MRGLRGIEDEISRKGSLLAKGTGFRHSTSAQVPRDRFPECLPEEPGAVIPHAGICEGGVGQPVFLH